jgi:hypothetical protein
MAFSRPVRRFVAVHPVLTCVLGALLPILLRLSLIQYVPAPEAESHDEFSYLLGAETFVLGRLANPPHPMWRHFETAHVNQQPTYASKYPPAQSLVLAFGWKFLGHPWYGVLLSVGLMCGTICWMLQGWLPPRHAALGCFLAIILFGMSSYWVNSYWGGAIPATAGALVLGALPRLVKRPNPRTLLAAAAGAALLSMSRPYEGLVLVVVTGAALFWWRHKTGGKLNELVTVRHLAPAAILLFLSFAWMAYYNYRVTGNPWLLPYVVNNRAYVSSPFFWLLPRGPAPVYRVELVRRLAEWDDSFYVQARRNPLFLVRNLERLLLDTFPFRYLPLFAFGAVSLRKTQVALAIGAVYLAAVLMEKYALQHYLAPAIGIVFLLAMLGWRSLLSLRRGRPALGRLVAVLLFFGVVGSIGIEVVNVRWLSVYEPLYSARARVVHQLTESGPKHLVLVRYLPRHDLNVDWVRNHADIDGSTIVWAHDLGEAENRELLAYYKDRQVWLFEPDERPFKLFPYGDETK